MPYHDCISRWNNESKCNDKLFSVAAGIQYILMSDMLLPIWKIQDLFVRGYVHGVLE